MAARKRTHYHTWTHINSVVRRVPQRVSINNYNNQDRTWFNIHATYKPSLIDNAEAIKFENKVSNIVWYSAK